MRAIPYTYEDHYSILSRWWVEHNWSPIPPGILPKGFIIKDDDGDFLCAGFMYETVGTKLRSLEWVVSNPKVDKRLRAKSLDLLFESLLSLTEKGDLIMAFAANTSLIKRYVDNGFMETDKNMTTLIKVNK